MDEEDGRPGALAAQIGHPDALSDALSVSLRLPRLPHPSALIRTPEENP